MFYVLPRPGKPKGSKTGLSRFPPIRGTSLTNPRRVGGGLSRESHFPPFRKRSAEAAAPIPPRHTPGAPRCRLRKTVPAEQPASGQPAIFKTHEQPARPRPIIHGTAAGLFISAAKRRTHPGAKPAAAGRGPAVTHPASRSFPPLVRRPRRGRGRRTAQPRRREPAGGNACRTGTASRRRPG